MKSFDNPIYVTRPMLADLSMVNDKLDEVWRAKWLTNSGCQHNLLEERLKEVLKVDGISLFNNGTIALMIALRCLDISGEVITTPFTFPATAHALEWVGCTPVFCDIDAKTMNIDADRIEELITPHTTAILPVHVFGVPCEVHKIKRIADKHGLKVIYDAAHAFGTEIDGIGIGTFGDITMFSFHATKLYHTIEGGALTFNDIALKSKINLLKNFGIKNEDEVVLSGINGKMNEVQAAVGLVNLECLEKERKNRQKLLKLYIENLGGIEGLSFYMLPDNIRNSFQYFVIRIDKNKFGLSRDEVYSKLKEYNVFTRKYFYPLCSDFPCYCHLDSSAVNNLLCAHSVVNEVLSMPFYGTLALDDAYQICSILKHLKKESQ